MFVIREDLPPILRPIAFLLGVWEGEGVGEYPTITGFSYKQRLTIEPVEGRPYFIHESRTWHPETNLAMGSEVGFWRPQEDGTVELVLAHQSGIVEVYYGKVTARSVELTTDAVVRTASAKEVTAEHRLYGIAPDEDLAYVVEMAAVGQPLKPHLSAKLLRIADF